MKVGSRTAKTSTKKAPQGAQSGQKADTAAPASDPLFSPSSQTLAALDLAVTPRALSVPAIILPGFQGVQDMKQLFRLASHIDGRKDALSNKFHRALDLQSPVEMLVDKFNNRYDLQAPFASGSFGSIRLAKKPDPVVDQLYIAKEVKLRTPQGHSGPEQMLRNEIKAMLLAKSPLSPHAVLMTQKSAFILLPVLDGDAFEIFSALDKWAKKDEIIPLRDKRDTLTGLTKRQFMTVNEAREMSTFAMMKSALEALIPLHKANYAHNDIKPENFLYDRSGDMHLADYGLAARADDLEFKGTLDYMPFEMLISEEYVDFPYKKNPKKGDIWAVGASAMTALLGTNVVTRALGDGEVDISNDELQEDMIHSVSLYDNLWRDVQDIKSHDRKVSYLQRLHGEAFAMGRPLLKVLQDYPRLFDTIFWAMAPEPGDRPSPEMLLSELNHLFAPKEANLSSLIQGIGLAQRQSWNEQGRESALRKLIMTDAHMQRRMAGSKRPSPLHMSLYPNGRNAALGIKLPTVPEETDELTDVERSLSAGSSQLSSDASGEVSQAEDAMSTTPGKPNPSSF